MSISLFRRNTRLLNALRLRSERDAHNCVCEHVVAKSAVLSDIVQLPRPVDCDPKGGDLEPCARNAIYLALMEALTDIGIMEKSN